MIPSVIVITVSVFVMFYKKEIILIVTGLFQGLYSFIYLK